MVAIVLGSGCEKINDGSEIGLKELFDSIKHPAVINGSTGAALVTQIIKPFLSLHEPKGKKQEKMETTLPTGHGYVQSRQRLRSGAFMLNLFSLRGLPWTGADGQQKVQLTAAELESLRSELADVEEREAHMKARLEHIDGILRSARLSGYLYIRTFILHPALCSCGTVTLLRWTALPGEPAPIDDTKINDWLPRFIVLHGQCIFFYLLSTDLSPQDSTLLSDVVEVGSLPSFTREEEGTRYSFYILTRQGLRYECSHVSQIQVDTWLSALQTGCKVVSESDVLVPNGSSKK
ncbi:Pleckstrin (PH) domain-containing protein isoform 1 [Gossypium australe]|uniref:Pleckstrin (PH) domain-containing protein isoform 1 n=1 Tax=Gossypium australe TaxID=47621 RepID=A0A5B6VMK0_9ROSI|nr:Pleckstrin (PH) domain-containing protein isoform 1 [Gossypium australe]